MTPTQIARRFDALYADGTCGMTRRVLCDMVAQRESDLEDARAENANLREYIERKRDLMHFARLVDENSKLRELVRIAGTYCVNGLCGKDDGCPLYLGKPYCALPDRMRELGVEVEV